MKFLFLIFFTLLPLFSQEILITHKFIDKGDISIKEIKKIIDKSPKYNKTYIKEGIIQYPLYIKFSLKIKI